MIVLGLSHRKVLVGLRGMMPSAVTFRVTLIELLMLAVQQLLLLHPIVWDGPNMAPFSGGGGGGGSVL